jgi:hypothetical protein
MQDDAQTWKTKRVAHLGCYTVDNDMWDRDEAIPACH